MVSIFFIDLIMSGAPGPYAIALCSYPEDPNLDDMCYVLKTISYGYDSGAQAFMAIPDIAKEGKYSQDDLVVYKWIDKDSND